MYLFKNLTLLIRGVMSFFDDFLFLFSTSLSLDREIIAVSFTHPFSVLQQWWLSAPLEMHDQNAVVVTAP